MPRRRLTKKIRASRSAAADLGHALACGYARGSDVGLPVAGPGSLPGPQRGSDVGRFWRDVISGVQACRHAGADPADCCRFRAWSRRYVVRLCRTGGLFVAPVTPRALGLDGVRIFLSRLVRLACQAGPRLR